MSEDAPNWGLLPDAVRSRLRHVEWDNSNHLRARLLGDRTFPIRCGLKPPSGRQALDAMAHFQAYLTAWHGWSGPGRVDRETRDLFHVGNHDLPAALIIERFEDLAALVGPEAVARHRHWQTVFAPLRALDDALYPLLVRNLAALESLDEEAARKLAATLAQLEPGLGCGGYLRALPLAGVDTKFVEQHAGLLASFADALHDGAITRAGGLEAWLECRAVPRDWLHVRPLCEQCRNALGGMAVLQIPTSGLLGTPLPGDRILIVENLASGYALPSIPGTVAVFGGGANVKWTRADWLRTRRLGYWGDIDTWGLRYLAEVRRNQPGVLALLMDRETLLEHRLRIVDEKTPDPVPPDDLTPSESELYRDLVSLRYGGSCLEQERISADWARAAIDRWVRSPEPGLHADIS